jgi:Mg-chelatase subunit ChlD
MRVFAVLLLLGITLFSTAADAGKRKKKKKPRKDDIVVVVVMDRSGSMQGAKLESAKEAVRAIRELLPSKAELGVVTYDSQANVVLDRTRAGDEKAVSAAVDGITAGGGTNILPGLEAADAMIAASSKKRRLVLLISDGEAPYDGIADAVASLAAHGAVVSAVGVAGADRNLLQIVAEGGNGRLYMVEDVGVLPRIAMKEVYEVNGK